MENAKTAAFGRRFANAFEAKEFLWGHPIFQYQGRSFFPRCREVVPVEVDPISHEVAREKRPDTLTWFKVSSGPWIHPEHLLHETRLTHPEGFFEGDYNLVAIAPSFNGAIVKLAELVLKHYGDYVSGPANGQ